MWVRVLFFYGVMSCVQCIQPGSTGSFLQKSSHLGTEHFFSSLGRTKHHHPKDVQLNVRPGVAAVESGNSMSNSLDTLEELGNKNPLNHLEFVVEKLRRMILRHPEKLSEESNILVLPVHEKGSIEDSIVQRGISDTLQGQANTPCAQKYIKEGKTASEVVLDPGKVEGNLNVLALMLKQRILELLRLMSPRERLAFDQKMIATLDGERQAVQGTLNGFLKHGEKKHARRKRFKHEKRKKQKHREQS